MEQVCAHELLMCLLMSCSMPPQCAAVQCSCCLCSRAAVLCAAVLLCCVLTSCAVLTSCCAVCCVLTSCCAAGGQAKQYEGILHCGRALMQQGGVR